MFLCANYSPEEHSAFLFPQHHSVITMDMSTPLSNLWNYFFIFILEYYYSSKITVIVAQTLTISENKWKVTSYILFVYVVHWIAKKKNDAHNPRMPGFIWEILVWIMFSFELSESLSKLKIQRTDHIFTFKEILFPSIQYRVSTIVL